MATRFSLRSLALLRGRLFIAVACCLILTPLWIVTLFGRGLWTPDEPREADIAWRMESQAERAVPSLAGRPFLEKPPFTYWVAAAAGAQFPDHVAALRAPNLLYAAVTMCAVVLLGFEMGGAVVAWFAGLVSATFLLALQVASWLAADAPLVASVALAMLGFFAGLNATLSRVKLLWFLLMHAGFALAFMAKGPAGWLVPGLASIGLIAWERRWRELLTWELWVGAVIPASIIGAWAVAVLLSVDGTRTLTILLWSNVAERALSLSGGNALGYAVGHRNWPGKYIVEFPLYVLPWTFLFVAAVHRVWRLARTETDSASGGEQRRAWRFALCALIPPLLALSLAATSRGIYGAPLLPAAALMIGLWAKDGVFRPSRIDRRMMSATVWLVTLLATVLFASAAFIASADDTALRFASLAICLAIGAATAMWISWRMLRRREWLRTMAATIAGFLLSLLATAAVVFPAMDRWQDLDQLVRAIDRSAADRPIALYSPDETIVATLDRVLGARAAHVARATSIPAARALLESVDPPVFIIRLKGAGTGAVLERLKSLGVRVRPPRETPELLELTTRLPLVVERIFELPQGRRYALLARRDGVTGTSPAGDGAQGGD